MSASIQQVTQFLHCVELDDSQIVRGNFLKVLIVGDLLIVGVLLQVGSRSFHSTPRTHLTELDHRLSSLALVSQCLWKQNSDPTLNSPFTKPYETPESNDGDSFAFKFLDDKHAGLHFGTTSLSCFPELSAAQCLAFEKEMAARKHGDTHDLNTRRRSFHSSCLKPFVVNMPANWFLVSRHFMSIFGSKFALSNNKSNTSLCILDPCSHREASAFDDHFAHSFIILENTQLSSRLRRIFVCDNMIQHLCHFFWLLVLGFVLQTFFRTRSSCAGETKFGQARFCFQGRE